MSRTKLSNQNNLNVYEQLYDKNLTKEEIARINFNLLGYIKTLIEMDKQYNEWVRKRKS